MVRKADIIELMGRLYAFPKEYGKEVLNRIYDEYEEGEVEVGNRNQKELTRAVKKKLAKIASCSVEKPSEVEMVKGFIEEVEELLFDGMPASWAKQEDVVLSIIFSILNEAIEPVIHEMMETALSA